MPSHYSDVFGAVGMIATTPEPAPVPMSRQQFIDAAVLAMLGNRALCHLRPDDMQIAADKHADARERQMRAVTNPALGVQPPYTQQQMKGASNG